MTIHFFSRFADAPPAAVLTMSIQVKKYLASEEVILNLGLLSKNDVTRTTLDGFLVGMLVAAFCIHPAGVSQTVVSLLPNSSDQLRQA